MKSKKAETLKKKVITKKVSNSTTDFSSLRNEVVAYALQFEGNPYVWGGTSLTKGADCSGFAQSVFRDKGISIPRTSRAQATSGKMVSLSNLKPGDLVFYRKNGIINHVAIYIGEGKVISASTPSTGIKVSEYRYRKPYKAASYFDLQI
jgi:cell wall-associated NlpC family hydrolase